MSKWLWLASVCLMEGVGLDELYELYHACAELTQRRQPK
jgi:hypothetical protein